MKRDIVKECEGVLKKYMPKEERPATLVVGVSGGADSVALLCALAEVSKQLPLRLVAVHVHHMIRGEEADRDCRFVEALCQERQVELVVCREDVPAYAKAHGMTLEEAGRVVRYAAFEDIRTQWQGDYVVTAHHGDDNLETILMNYFRGSGLAGLAGMPEYSEERKLLRPFLRIRRRELEEWLASMGQEFVTDSTNLLEDAARNRLRNRVIPAINAYASIGAGDNILDSAARFGEMDDFFCREAERILSRQPGVGVLSLDTLQSLHPALGKYCIRMALAQVLSNRLKDITAKHIELIWHLAREGKTGGRIELPGNFFAVKEYQYLRISTDTGKTAEREPKWTMELSGPFPVEKDFNDFAKNTCNVSIDYDKIRENLFLRTRQTGDRIALYRSGQGKKVKDYLIDRKVPRQERDSLPMVVMGEHEVVWIPSYRVSEAFRVTEETKQVLFIKIQREVQR